MIKYFLAALLCVVGFAASAQEHAQIPNESNVMDELNPFDPNIDKTLENLDQMYMDETGASPFIENLLSPFASSCYRNSCKVWAQISRSRQEMYLYVEGFHRYTWLVSTGAQGYGTPNFDTHPNGRIYDKYTSSKYPGGDYNGLGNMPYAVFISGGFAIHGTGKSNWKKLGQKASHGCVRIHPDNAFVFNRLVRQYGIRNVWITVHE